MNNFTRIFLVLLRLAIGWLFLFEGIEKVHSVQLGPTVNSKPFSSAGFLAQSSGPASSFFHWQAGGDADEKALERLTVRPLSPGEAANVAPHERIAPALKQDWEDYLTRFADHYQLTPEQMEQAKDKIEKAEDNAVAWLLDDKSAKDLDKDTTFPGAAFTPWKTPAARVAAYRAGVEEYRRAQNEVLPAFGEDVYKAKLRAMKADAARQRQSILDDLDEPMRKSLTEVLTSEQKAMPALTAPAAPAQLIWTDKLVSWGLVVIGAGLLLGFLTRLNCVGGALFLIMLYLALPALPWSPENIKAEGHYLFVTKNLILALALLALATTRSGMWFGLDGLFQFLNPWRYRARKPEPATV
jgi:uncharacterized membrane protein YphA (DoxX/SURF4 family)